MSAATVNRVRVTPAMAREMLKRKGHSFSRGARRGRRNDFTSRRNVEEIKAIWLRGEELVGWAGSWLLLVNRFVWNGHHRLTALSEMPDDFAVAFWIIEATSLRVRKNGAVWNDEWTTALGVAASYEAARQGIPLYELTREAKDQGLTTKREKRAASYSKSLRSRLQGARGGAIPDEDRPTPSPDAPRDSGGA